MPTVKLSYNKNASVEDNVQRAFDTLNWAFGKLSSKNVKRLDTNETNIKSKDGETQIIGPLLVMRDKQGTPVVRLQMGYDAETDEFTFKLLDGAGELTAYIDSDGKLVVEVGEFKGTIDIGSGNFTVDAGGVVRVKTNMTVGNKIFFDSGIDDKGIYMGLSYLECIFADGKYNLHILSNGYFNLVSDGDMTIMSGTAVYPGGDWDCTDAAFVSLTDGSSPYATRLWVTSQGYITGVSGASGTFTTADGKTVTITNGLVTSII
jgi:hypothetical protein